MHGYRNSEGPGGIEMHAELDPGSLCVRVRDHGQGLMPRLDSTGLGLGLPLIAELSTHSQIITPTQGGTEVIMRFDIYQQDGASRP